MKLITKFAVLRICLGLSLWFGGCLLLPVLIQPGRLYSKPVSAIRVFKSETGNTACDAWRVMDAGDTHGGFVGDGETHAVFQLTQPQVDALLAQTPPWSAEWKMGPVPHEIGFHCGFGTDGVGYGGSDGDVPEYFGKGSIVDLLSSNSIRYDAKERCCDTLRWHNGHLLVVDPRTLRVWLSVWDF